MIWDFDDQGNIFPYRKVELSLNNCLESFVDGFAESQSRRDLFENLLKYRSDLRVTLNNSFTQWINGSFVTKKLNPNDIDLVNLIPHDDAFEYEVERLLPFFTVGGSLEAYRIDAHLIPVYPENDPRFENTKLRRTYFETWFGSDRNGHPKGFIEITEP